jgi:hypothetical protein
VHPVGLLDEGGRPPHRDAAVFAVDGVSATTVVVFDGGPIHLLLRRSPPPPDPIRRRRVFVVAEDGPLDLEAIAGTEALHLGDVVDFGVLLPTTILLHDGPAGIVLPTLLLGDGGVVAVVVVAGGGRRRRRGRLAVFLVHVRFKRYNDVSDVLRKKMPRISTKKKKIRFLLSEILVLSLVQPFLTGVTTQRTGSPEI